MTVRVSVPQRELLDEIAETELGVLYIRHYSRYGRTASALLAKGLLEVVEQDHSSLRMDGYGIVKCTGIAATWCPICGDCTCPERGHDVRDVGGRDFSAGEGTCPLHRTDGRHGDLTRWPQ